MCLAGKAQQQPAERAGLEGLRLAWEAERSHEGRRLFLRRRALKECGRKKRRVGQRESGAVALLATPLAAPLGSEPDAGRVSSSAELDKSQVPLFFAPIESPDAH